MPFTTVTTFCSVCLVDCSHLRSDLLVVGIFVVGNFVPTPHVLPTRGYRLFCLLLFCRYTLMLRSFALPHDMDDSLFTGMGLRCHSSLPADIASPHTDTFATTVIPLQFPVIRISRWLPSRSCTVHAFTVAVRLISHSLHLLPAYTAYTYTRAHTADLHTPHTSFGLHTPGTFTILPPTHRTRTCAFARHFVSVPVLQRSDTPFRYITTLQCLYISLTLLRCYIHRAICYTFGLPLTRVRPALICVT